jgi:hypothetical protein
MNTSDKDLMLPYLVIARMNGLRKDKPDDPDDLVWVSDKGERYVLTPKGFVNSIQYSYIMLYKEVKKELELTQQDFAELKKKYDNHMNTCAGRDLDNDMVGKKSKKRIRSILNGDNYRTIEDRFEAIKKYLKEK